MFHIVNYCFFNVNCSYFWFKTGLPESCNNLEQFWEYGALAAKEPFGEGAEMELPPQGAAWRQRV